MSSICRLCASLKKVENFVNIRDPNLNLLYKLEKCCNLHIQENDNLPQNVCVDCLKCLEESWKFFIRVQDAQESLINVFGCQDNKSFIIEKKENYKILQKLINPINTQIGVSVTASTSAFNDNDDSHFKLLEILQSKEIDNSQFKDTENHNLENEENNIFYKTEDITCEQQYNIEQYNESSNEIIEEDGVEEEEKKVGKDAEEDGDDIGGNLVEITDFNEEINVENIEHYEEINEAVDFEINEIIENDDDGDDGDGDDGGKDDYDNDNEEKETWNEYAWKCVICDIFVTNSKNLQKHYYETHNKQTQIDYYCIDCMKTFPRYYTFLNHVKYRHRKNLQLCCDICFKYLKNPQELSKHRILLHSKEKKDCIICATCGKAFKNQTSLQIHSNCHKPYEAKYIYKCEFCDKKFGTKQNLKAHEKIHIGLKDYVCDQCGKGFVQKANLEEHLLTHKNEFPYECDGCNKRFKTPARLTKHKIVHTDVKPYECQTCGRLFRERDTLKVHSRIHTGAMPFECEYCGKRFRFKSILTTHRHQHTGVRPYSCIECNHHFTNWPNYNKHMKRRHGIDTSSSARKSQTETGTTSKTMTTKQKIFQGIELTSDSCVSGGDGVDIGTISTSELVTSTTEISNFETNNINDIATSTSSLL